MHDPLWHGSPPVPPHGSDDEKVDVTFRKLAKLHLDNEDAVAAAETLRMLVDRLTGEKKIVEVWRSIAQTLSTMANLPEEHTPKLQEALEHSLNDSVLGENETNYQSYLRLLYRTGQLARLVVAAQTMARIFPTYLPLEWICRMFVRWTAYPVEGNEFPLSQEETTEYMGKLLRINKASPWGNLARGLMYREEGSLVEAKAHLRLGECRDAVARRELSAGGQTTGREIVEVWRSIAQTCPLANLPEEHTPKLQEALEHSLNDSVLGENETNYQSYLRLLYRTGQLARLVVAAQTMARIFPTYLPLEWICRMFVRWTAYPVEGNEFPLSQEETTEYMGKLLRINKASPWGNLARGLMYREEGSLVEAKAHLRLGADNIKNSLMGWELLRSVQEESSDWPGVETSCRKSLAILSGDARPTVPGGEDPQAYETRLRLTQARALVHMGHKNHLKKAVDMLEQVRNSV
ncbi:hypothetical protein GWK47_000849 [Chionoecetes opilio]|uniref:Uncharacterized protein n=1 Tax=Chionoecetes opilio TaxID=41210 RepID=A0A8J4Y090_CHIOP|nr:hypothetical protein GWK47_000849 [Chionoecetes opilio]